MKFLKSLKPIVGKTVKSVDHSSCNCVTINFTDNTSVLLEAENALPSSGLIAISAYDVSKTVEVKK